jgi:hypothetical protein
LCILKGVLHVKEGEKAFSVPIKAQPAEKIQVAGKKETRILSSQRSER